jgi:LysM repeat protein
MTARQTGLRSIRIRRRGRHKIPSQIDKVAEKAGKAAPAMAIAGALVASAQAQHAFAASAKPATVASAKPATVASAGARGQASAHDQHTTAATLDSVRTRAILASSVARKARHAAARNTYYKVRPGDTLGKIAAHFYHNADDWQWLYHENAKTVPDPDVIYPGQTLFVPADPPAHYTLSGYVPRHAKPAAHSGSEHSGSEMAVVQTVSHSRAKSSGPASGGSGSTTLSGTLSCSGLERLWEQAGGNPAGAFTAAEIAMAESGGNQYALSPTDDYGYWQINGSHGALATFNPYGNARAAVIISNNGTDWSPWTTYTSGAYAGRC